MIRDAVYALLEEAGEFLPVSITISVPAGVEAAKKTFNPVLGIEGGISVLGTSGIVEPMSEEALVETIRTHLNVLRAEGRKWVIAVPGNMGRGILKGYLTEQNKNQRWFYGSIHELLSHPEQLRWPDHRHTAELGFSGILIAGHMGKLVKIGNGIMNTHSREADRPHGHDAVLCVIRRNRRSGTFKKDPGIQHDG